MSRIILNLLRSDGSIIINKNLARNIGIDEASRWWYDKSTPSLTFHDLR
jgi:hypothetical protein